MGRGLAWILILLAGCAGPRSEVPSEETTSASNSAANPSVPSSTPNPAPSFEEAPADVREPLPLATPTSTETETPVALAPQVEPPTPTSVEESSAQESPAPPSALPPNEPPPAVSLPQEVQPSEPEAPAEMDTSSFDSQFGNCENISGATRRIYAQLQPSSYFTSLGLSAAEADRRRLAAYQRFQELSLTVRTFIQSMDLYGLELSILRDDHEIGARLFNTGDYLVVQRDCRLAPSLTPNDAQYAGQYALPLIGADDAWDTTTGGSTAVTIAILDSGIDAAQEDLATLLVPGINTADVACTETSSPGCGTTTPIVTADSCRHHGTQVASVAAAIGNNTVGMAGVGWNFRVMPVRVSDNAVDCSASTTDIVEGIIWASENGAKVINVSFEGAYLPIIQSTAQRARRNGALVVYSSGNGSSDLYTLCTAVPLSADICARQTHDDVLIVGATDASDVLAAFSNTGSLVDIVAPGVGITAASSGGGYSAVNGTSFSAPLVSGAAALIFSVRPSWGPSDVERLLLESAVDLGAAGEDSSYGVGRLALDVAFTTLLAGTQTSTTIANRKLDFQIPSGPVKIAVADQQIRGGGRSKLYIFSQSNKGLMSFNENEAGNREVVFSELPAGVDVGRNSLFYMKDDESTEFVFTDNARTKVYMGSTTQFNTTSPGPAVIAQNACGPFQEISAIHLTEDASGVLSRLIVADKRANRIYSYALDPTGNALCTSALSAILAQPIWIRSVNSANPRIYVGYQASNGLYLQDFQNSDLSTISAAQRITASTTARYSTPLIDTTNNDLWVSVSRDDVSDEENYLVQYPYAGFPPVSPAAFPTCLYPTQVVQDYEGASRLMYVLCPSSREIFVYDATPAYVTRIPLSFTPRKISVTSDGTTRYLSILRGDTLLSVLSSAIASPLVWTQTNSATLPAVMDDLGQFASFDYATVVNAEANLISLVSLTTPATIRNDYLPRAVDALSVQSPFVSHFVSTDVNRAYSLQEEGSGAWRLKAYTTDTAPKQIAYRTNKLYTRNQSGDSISVISLNDGSTLDIATQTKPIHFDFNTTVDRLWAVNETGQSLTTIDITRNAESVLSTTALGFAPKKVLYQSSDDTLYVAGPTTVRVLNGTTLATIRNVTISSGVSDMVLQTGGVWVTSRTGLTGTYIDRSTTTTTTLSASPNLLTSNESTPYAGLPGIQTVIGPSGISKIIGSFSNLFSTLSYMFSYNLGSRVVKIWPYDQMSATTFAGLSLPIPFDVDRFNYDANGNIWVGQGSTLKVHRIDSSLQMQTLGNVGINRAVDLVANTSENRVYFLMRNLNALFTYDTVNDRLSAFSTCQSPRKLALDSTDAQVFILCPELNAVAMISLDNQGDPLRQSLYATRLGPADMVLNSATNRLYVSNKLSDSVQVWNTASMSTAPTAITTLDTPAALALNSVTNTIHVFYEYLRYRSSINGGSNAITHTVIGSYGYTKAEVNTTSALAYAISTSARSVFLDPSLVLTTSTILTEDPSPRPLDLAVSSTRSKAYVSFADEDVIRIYAEAGTSTDVAVGDDPRNLYVNDGLNRVYVANFADDSVSILSTTTNAILGTATLSTGCGPTRMQTVTISGTDYIYVLCSLSDTVEVLNATTYAVGTPVSLRLPN